jgi:hypothetical protein
MCENRKRAISQRGNKREKYRSRNYKIHLDCETMPEIKKVAARIVLKNEHATSACFRRFLCDARVLTHAHLSFSDAGPRPRPRVPNLDQGTALRWFKLAELSENQGKEKSQSYEIGFLLN